jgi:Family of unknown function (DUF6065)
MSSPEFEIAIFQLVGDELFKSNRTDGTGWDWSWADWRRDWMDATPVKYAYRCLPLTIANQTGWWIRNPVGFTACWSGNSSRGQVEFRFDRDPELWSQIINDQFGHGIITWNTPFLFRTKPAGSRLLICGPTNVFKHGIQALTALIESDWMTMSFTMNWKFTASGVMSRFEAGEPLFQAIPLVGNVCRDLERAHVTYEKLCENPEMLEAYNEWHDGRKQFHEDMARGNVRSDGWQKDYFHARGAAGQQVAAEHITKVVPPEIHRNSAVTAN